MSSSARSRGAVSGRTAAQTDPPAHSTYGTADAHKGAPKYEIGQSVRMTRDRGGPDDGALRALFAGLAARDEAAVSRILDQEPDLARRSLGVGASRQEPKAYFILPIRHHVYAGDTALHIAAAAHHRAMAEGLVVRGAAVRARNRRGAEPLHYAADGGPSSDRDWDGQREVIAYLIEAGSDPDATDKSGVAPLHRAVRNRSSVAVEALIDNGADPRLTNKSGSTPLHLAVQTTGKSGSGSDAAKEAQHRIILMLLDRGARPTDVDARGRTVAATASSEWIREVLANH